MIEQYLALETPTPERELRLERVFLLPNWQHQVRLILDRISSFAGGRARALVYSHYSRFGRISATELED